MSFAFGLADLEYLFSNNAFLYADENFNVVDFGRHFMTILPSRTMYRTALSIVALSSTRPFSLVSKFGTSTSVIDEPITDLIHADPSCLFVVSESMSSRHRVTVDLHWKISLSAPHLDMDWRCSIDSWLAII